MCSLKMSCVTKCNGMQHFANFKSGGIDIQRGIFYVLLNSLSISLLSRLNDTTGYFGMQKSRHIILGVEENRSNVGGRLGLFASNYLKLLWFIN